MCGPAHEGGDRARSSYGSTWRCAPSNWNRVIFFLISVWVLALFYAVLRDCTCLAELDATRCGPRWLLAIRLGFRSPLRRFLPGRDIH
jgi:hypothetical protein